MPASKEEMVEWARGLREILAIFLAFVFGDIFGGGQSRQGRSSAQRGADLRYLLDLDLEQPGGPGIRWKFGYR
ncbi:MAG: hypothetical protein CM1200mP9_05730 [Gammaproteobacteria bacterium]|nr:MAG: hypothetical protein CM1200mP9_05730 [Gammaproteobacteria bacterium]